jgi:4-diphosphocytidyl-2-C-methyl-D-erythritol kinase
VSPLRLLARAPGKVNLSLFLGEVRPDGRHELVTLLESVSLADELTLSVEPGLSADVVECPGVEGPNLAGTALAALRTLGWDAPPVRIEIRKRVPVTAGMGGGSADAAAALRLACELVPLPAGIDLERLGADLGADVPSQLQPGLWLGRGAGELIEPVPPPAAHAFVIVPLAPALSTAAVYREADRLALPRAAAELDGAYARLRSGLAGGSRLAADLLVNDLQPATVSLCPDVGATLAALRETDADAVLVSGSGPTVFGLFWGETGRARAAAGRLSQSFAGVDVAVPVDARFGAVSRVG